MSQCFIASAQELMLQKLREIPQAQREQTTKNAKKSKFQIDKLTIDGDQAVMTFSRHLGGGEPQKEVLHFVREAGGWKMTPNE